MARYIDLCADRVSRTAVSTSDVASWVLVMLAFPMAVLWNAIFSRPGFPERPRATKE